MKPEKWMDVIGGAKDEYVLSAWESRYRSARPKRLSLKRTMLIAAVIAMALLLVGCGVVYVLSLQEKQISQTTVTRYFDEEGQRVSPTEVTQDVISLFGYEGTPSHMAMAEWYAFTESYDPELKQMTDDNEAGIPDNYYFSYSCYTWEMVEALEEILDKYGLKALGPLALVQNWDTEIFFEALGLEGLCHGDADADIQYRSGYFYPEGAFKFDVDITLTGEDALWTDTVWSTAFYTPKDYFDPKYTSVDTEYYDQWMYTTADGTEILIAMSARSAMLFAEQEDAYITVTMNTDVDFMSPTDDGARTTREALQQLADVWDFTIRPQAVADMDAVQARLDASMASREAAQEAAYQQALANAPKFASYAGYLQSEYTRLRPSLRYALWDLDGDGTDDLLLADQSGCFSSAVTIYGGNVVEMYSSERFQVCENGALACSSAGNYYRTYAYVRLGTYDAQALRYNVTEYTFLWNDASENVWEYSDLTTNGIRKQLTEAEVQAIRSQYIPLELETFPLMEYPMDTDGTTLEDVILANRFFVSQEEMLAIYADYLENRNPTDPEIRHSYYCLRDFNGDGVTDLLLGKDDSHFCCALTVHNGELKAITQWTTAQLCENGSFTTIGSNSLCESHTFWKFENGEQVQLDYVYYDAQKDLWSRSSDGDSFFDETLTEAEARSILASYPLLDMDMQPVGQFPAA